MLFVRCLTPILLLFAGVAVAQPLAAEWQNCAKSDTAPDEGIAACSAIIESGAERGKNLAIALFNRANAWLAAYDLARQIGFNETAALGQADTAWDRAAEPWRLPAGDEPAYTLTEFGRRAMQVRR